MSKSEWGVVISIIIVIVIAFYGIIQLQISSDKETRKKFIQCTQKTKDVTWCYDSIK